MQLKDKKTHLEPVSKILGTFGAQLVLREVDLGELGEGLGEAHQLLEEVCPFLFAVSQDGLKVLVDVLQKFDNFGSSSRS